MKKLKLSALLALGLFVTGAQAQEALPATGGNASGSSGSVSYSVGQVFYYTLAGDNVTLLQGVQQPYEISVISGMENAGGISLDCMVYPNPTMDKLTMKVDSFDPGNLSFQLFNPNGKLLVNKKLTGKETTISLGNLMPGIYFLKVLDKQKEIKTFKIVKR
jgi:hypothetical protein